MILEKRRMAFTKCMDCAANEDSVCQNILSLYWKMEINDQDDNEGCTNGRPEKEYLN